MPEEKTTDIKLCPRFTYESAVPLGDLTVRMGDVTEKFIEHFEIEPDCIGFKYGPKTVSQVWLYDNQAHTIPAIKAAMPEGCLVATLEFRPVDSFWGLSLVQVGNLASRSKYISPQDELGVFTQSRFDGQGRATEVPPDKTGGDIWKIVESLLGAEDTPRMTLKAKQPTKLS